MMTRPTSRIYNPAGVPTIGQPSLFFSTLPVELRCEIYSYIFTPSATDKVPSHIAAPLLTCRQWYIETRGIAFATINWRINLGPLYRRNVFDENVRIHHGESGEDEPYWLDVDEDEFCPERRTLRYMFVHANLSSQHIKSLRRLTIVNCWYGRSRDARWPGPRHELVWRLLHDALPHYQLKSVTLEYPDTIPYTKLEGLFSAQWRPDLNSIWDTKIMKSLVLKNCFYECVTHDLISMGSVDKIELVPLATEIGHKQSRPWADSEELFWSYEAESY
jgi:hypothetical protein